MIFLKVAARLDSLDSVEESIVRGILIDALHGKSMLYIMEKCPFVRYTESTVIVHTDSLGDDTISARAVEIANTYESQIRLKTKELNFVTAKKLIDFQAIARKVRKEDTIIFTAEGTDADKAVNALVQYINSLKK